MTLTVVPMPDPTPNSEYMIASLEALIELAKQGNIESFCLAALQRDGSITRAHGYSTDASKFTLIGVMTHEARYMSQKIDAMNSVTNHMED